MRQSPAAPPLPASHGLGAGQRTGLVAGRPGPTDSARTSRCARDLCGQNQRLPWNSGCYHNGRRIVYTLQNEMPVIEKAKEPLTRTVSFRIPFELAAEVDAVRAELAKAGAQLDLTDPVLKLLRKEVKNAKAYLAGRMP